jgi:hypothetical protein
LDGLGNVGIVIDPLVATRMNGPDSSGEDASGGRARMGSASLLPPPPSPHWCAIKCFVFFRSLSGDGSGEQEPLPGDAAGCIVIGAGVDCTMDMR